MQLNLIDGCSEHVDFLKNALDASGVRGAWEWDHFNGVVTYDYGAAVLLTGNPELAEREICDEEAISAVHPDDKEWLREHMIRAVTSGGLVLAEYRVIAPEYGTRWLLSRGRTYKASDGRPITTRGIVIDITESRGSGERYVKKIADSADAVLDRILAMAMGMNEMVKATDMPLVKLLSDMLLIELGKEMAKASLMAGLGPTATRN